MNPVTLWYRVIEDKKKFNHLEDGHNTTGRPTSKLPCHDKMWRKGVWEYELAQIDEQYKVVHDEATRLAGVEYDEDD